jgi:pyruvate/2-oxoglutarate dehydrogenase complex dihydrolipoamide dehydrogenase (E3) component
MGGTCVNNGCVPKKLMWYAANLAHAVDNANGFGIPTRRGKTDWQRLVDDRETYISNINDYWDGYIDDLHITHIQGQGRNLASPPMASSLWSSNPGKSPSSAEATSVWNWLAYCRP